ncbi:MAG: L,D-transpeptidase [Candidatus Dormibacter sp.]
MRLRYYLIPAFLIVCVASGGAVTVHAAGDRHRTFADGAAGLRAEWNVDQAQGVPASSLAPLRAALSAQTPDSAWWSPSWLNNDGHVLLSRLQGQTRTAWNAALDGRRTEAQGVIAQWAGFATQQKDWVTGAASTSAGQWTTQLDGATTPAAVSALIASWQTFIGQQRTAVTAAQKARVEQLQQELQSVGGAQTVLATAQRLVSIANADNLNAGNVAALAAQLNNEIAGNADASQTAGKLLTAINALQALVDLNDQISGQLYPLLLTIDQAEAEGTPNAAALAAQNAGIAGQFQAASTAAQLNAVAQTVSAVTGRVNAELAAHSCGHPVGGGKVITISLSLQEMVFYQDGCVVKATAVSTGRPQLRTPTGTFHIFNKQTPFQFISPWPKSSPFYYYPSWVSWVMEFAGGGYFIHDAPWESSGAYGPGSEDNPSAASHGCVHVPTAVMQWAYPWTSDGTPVVIS